MRQSMFIPDRYKNDKTIWAKEENIKKLEKEGFEQAGVVFHELTLLVRQAPKKKEIQIKKEVVKKVEIAVKKVVNKKKNK